MERRFKSFMQFFIVLLILSLNILSAILKRKLIFLATDIVIIYNLINFMTFLVIGYLLALLVKNGVFLKNNGKNKIIMLNLVLLVFVFFGGRYINPNIINLENMNFILIVLFGIHIFLITNIKNES